MTFLGFNSFVYSLWRITLTAAVPLHPCERCPCGGGTLWPSRCHAWSLTPLMDGHDMDVSMYWQQPMTFSCVMWTVTHLSLWRPGLLGPECDWTAPLPPYWDKINKKIRTGAARGLLANDHSSLLQSWCDNKVSHCAAQCTAQMSPVFWATADSDDASCEDAFKGKTQPRT